MRLLFCASGRFPDDQGWECDMGLHIEIRSFDLLQNILPGLHPHIVDIDVHDREHGLQNLRKWKVIKSNHLHFLRDQDSPVMKGIHTAVGNIVVRTH